MNIVKPKLHCPYCGKSFSLELEESVNEDDLIEECPLCGSPIDIRLVMDPEKGLVGAEAHRVDGDTDE
ncbi:MAG TPA: CPXCG motif-containing cysteine-rich protein [Gammaproteobacteria bacterium]|nr:CPXCG motif-containing cysteine-rich protein [Gammaproteobacteria bacterium]